MALIYRITELGPPERGGEDQPITAEIAGVAKTNDGGPYTIANELVAAHLGIALGLPVPVGVLAQDDWRKLYYLSLDVSAEGKQLPPVDPEVFATEEPWWSAGCVAFDILIANGDRNADNIARDEGFAPPRVSMFDHGRALLGRSQPLALARLALHVNGLGCEGTAGGRNVLMDHIDTDEYLAAWVERIKSLPDFIFSDACNLLPDDDRLNVDRELSYALAEWLRSRGARMRSLISEHRNEFPRIDTWGILWEAP